MNQEGEGGGGGKNLTSKLIYTPAKEENKYNGRQSINQYVKTFF